MSGLGWRWGQQAMRVDPGIAAGRQGAKFTGHGGRATGYRLKGDRAGAARPAGPLEAWPGSSRCCGSLPRRRRPGPVPEFPAARARLRIFCGALAARLAHGPGLRLSSRRHPASVRLAATGPTARRPTVGLRGLPFGRQGFHARPQPPRSGTARLSPLPAAPVASRSGSLPPAFTLTDARPLRHTAPWNSPRWGKA